MENVTITLKDGSTVSVHPDTPVRMEEDNFIWDAGTIASDDDSKDSPVAVYDPMRESWVPYEAWMHDLLQDDARTSTVFTDNTEMRKVWSSLRTSYIYTINRCKSTRIHPEDVPEKPSSDLTRDIEREVLNHSWFTPNARTFSVIDIAATMAKKHYNSEIERLTRERDEAQAEKANLIHDLEGARDSLSTANKRTATLINDRRRQERSVHSNNDRYDAVMNDLKSEFLKAPNIAAEDAICRVIDRARKRKW